MLSGAGGLNAVAAAASRSAARAPSPLARHVITGAAVALAAAAFGAIVALQPALAAAGVAFALLLALPFAFPVAHLVLLVFATAILPFGIQNQLSLGGGAGTPGLLLSDALLLGGLLRAAIVLPRAPLERRQLLAAGLVLLFLGLAALQFMHGIAVGRSTSDVGFELRVLLGFGAVLLALPLLRDHGSRSRLMKGLLLSGLLVGLWGLAQWLLDVPHSVQGDFGVREGVAFTTVGRGQVQGGLYAFPVAAALAFAVLISGQVRRAGWQAALAAVLALNIVSMMLTYERTFWVVTVLAFGFIALRGGRLARARALVWLPLVAILLLAALGTLAPDALTAARERLLSLNQYAHDDSVRFRLVESERVIERIDERPLVGSGLGAEILMGQPWNQVPPSSTWYAHNGYLWIAWKLGIPAALLLSALLALTLLWRAPPKEDALFRAFRIGAQGALLALAVASITFPAFNSLSITATMGLLLAVVAAPAARRRRSAAPAS